MSHLENGALRHEAAFCAMRAAHRDLRHHHALKAIMPASCPKSGTLWGRTFRIVVAPGGALTSAPRDATKPLLRTSSSVVQMLLQPGAWCLSAPDIPISSRMCAVYGYLPLLCKRDTSRIRMLGSDTHRSDASGWHRYNADTGVIQTSTPNSAGVAGQWTSTAACRSVSDTSGGS